jgi:hypothetical protein
MDLQQCLLLLIAICTPLVLLFTGRNRALLIWVCVTLFVQVFDTVTLTNLPAGRIVGILYLPSAWTYSKKWFGLAAPQAWLCNYLYLCLLAVAWGFLWQWPDITAARPITQLGPGRSCIYLARLLSDFSLGIFVAQELCKPGALQTLRCALIAGSTITALGSVAAFLTDIDLYHLLTGLGSDLSEIGRARGFSYEPRGLGMACVYGSLLLVLHRRLTVSWLVLIAINLLGLALSGSTSALAMFSAGLAVIGITSGLRKPLLTGGAVALSFFVVCSLAMLAPRQFNFIVDEVLYRIDPTEKLMGAEAEDLGERIAYQLDVFDASALLFLLHDPLYFLTGTGPGLVSLPASYHVPPGLYSLVWTDDIGINTLPTHGLLLEICNSGLPGLGSWLVQIWASWMALRALTRRSSSCDTEAWIVGRAMFVLGAALYFVQVSVSPVWSVFSAIGWSASMLSRARRKSVSEQWRLKPHAAGGTVQGVNYGSSSHSLRRSHA